MKKGSMNDANNPNEQSDVAHSFLPVVIIAPKIKQHNNKYDSTRPSLACLNARLKTQTKIETDNIKK